MNKVIIFQMILYSVSGLGHASNIDDQLQVADRWQPHRVVVSFTGEKARKLCWHADLVKHSNIKCYRNRNDPKREHIAEITFDHDEEGYGKN